MQAELQLALRRAGRREAASIVMALPTIGVQPAAAYLAAVRSLNAVEVSSLTGLLEDAFSAITTHFDRVLPSDLETLFEP